MDYTKLSLSEVRAGLDAVARETQETFGALDGRQLNWRPDAGQWSVAQCFGHLVAANRLMAANADEALDPAQPRTIWQRLPGLPGLLGRMMIRSQAPGAGGKFKAPPPARPDTSDLAPAIITQFIEQQRDFARRLTALDESRAARVVMTSPFVKVITYTVLDGWRLMLAHDRRHFEQARRVTELPGFPQRGG